MKRTIIGLTILALVLVFSFMPAAYGYTPGQKHIKVSQTEINSILKKIKTGGIYAGPNMWPVGAQINFTCGSSGCGLVFNEKATQGLEALITLGIGITGVATAISALTGVGVPLAAIVGLVCAMFTATESWMAFADWWGGNIGIYGAWYTGSLVFYIWCNPIPSQFTPAITTTTSTQTQTTTSIRSTSSVSTSSDPTTTTTTYHTSTTTASSCPGVAKGVCY